MERSQQNCFTECELWMECLMRQWATTARLAAWWASCTWQLHILQKLQMLKSGHCQKGNKRGWDNSGRMNHVFHQNHCRCAMGCFWLGKWWTWLFNCIRTTVLFTKKSLSFRSFIENNIVLTCKMIDQSCRVTLFSKSTSLLDKLVLVTFVVQQFKNCSAVSSPTHFDTNPQIVVSSLQWHFQICFSPKLLRFVCFLDNNSKCPGQCGRVPFCYANSTTTSQLVGVSIPSFWIIACWIRRSGFQDDFVHVVWEWIRRFHMVEFLWRFWKNHRKAFRRSHN